VSDPAQIDMGTETISDVVASRVQQLRERRGWSARQLAEACAATGNPQLTESVVANIESGRRDKQGRRRRGVSVDELVAFAQALDVSIGLADATEVLGDLDLPNHKIAEHYRLALQVAQAAWDHDLIGCPDDATHTEVHQALVALRRHEMRVGPKVLVHPMTRSRG